jgi:hypothetical protein
MLGDGILLTSTSSGTGNLTLAGVNGFPDFLATGIQVGQRFPYTILALMSGEWVLREAGWGKMADSTTLVRARVVAKSDGVSTYSNGALTPTDFGGTLVRVLCSPHAASTMTMLPTVDGQSSGINRFLSSAGRSVSQSPQQLTSLTLYYVHFLLRCGGWVTSLSLNVTTPQAGNGRAGVYDVNEKGYVGKLLTSSADIDVGTSGLKTSTLATPIFLPPGDYFTGAVVSTGGTGASLTAYTTNVAQVMGGGPLGFSGIAPIEFRTETLGSLVLPSTASATTSGTGYGAVHPPCVFLGVQ